MGRKSTLNKHRATVYNHLKKNPGEHTNSSVARGTGLSNNQVGRAIFHVGVSNPTRVKYTGRGGKKQPYGTYSYRTPKKAVRPSRNAKTGIHSRRPTATKMKGRVGTK